MLLKRLKRFITNAMLLGATTILMRSVAVIFNAYVSGKIGAEGMGLYSLITSVYAFAVTLAASGVSLAVMRLVSEELGKGNEAGALLAMKKCASPLMKELKVNAQIPVITKAADAKKVLSEDAMKLFSLDVAGTNLYNKVTATKFHSEFWQDMKHNIELL